MTHPASHQIPPEVAAVLVRLRRSIRRYVFLEGTAIVLVVLGVLFWLSLGLDTLWFQWNKLELPRWFRAAFLVAGAGCVAAAFGLWIALRMFRRFRLKALALVIERRFPEFDDRLITAVEAMDGGTGRESALTRAMLDRTVRQAADEARGIDVGAVFERRPLRRALIAAVVLVVGIGAFAATNAHAMNRWWRAYFALHEEYWERSYHLEVLSVTPPDDRVRPLDSAKVHLHPKGGTFVPLMIVPDSQARLRALADRQRALLAEAERLSAADPLDPAAVARLFADQFQLARRLVLERAELRLPPGDLDAGDRIADAIEEGDWPEVLAAQSDLAETLTRYSAAVEPWRIPDRVEFKYQIAGQNRTRPVTCTPVTDQALLDQHQALAIFRHSLSELIGDLTFSVYGGDYTNRDPYEVRVVEPPRIVQPTLHCDFPPHAIPPTSTAGTRNSPGIPVAVHGGQIALPVETRFLLEGKCNKPLTAVRIEFGDRTIELRAERPAVSDDLLELESGLNWRTSGRVIRQPADGGRREIRELSALEAARWLPPGSDAFQIPFIMSEGATEPARERMAADLFDFGTPVVLSPGTRLRVHLTDGHEIVSVQPETLEIVGVSDEPPRLAEIRLRGIGNMITRHAVIPFTGLITDDNGLAEAKFEFQVDDSETVQIREFRNPPAKFPREFELSRSAKEEFEQFDVARLDLQEGQTLRVNIHAADADRLNGPHVTRSEKFVFQIISHEELLALLYGRELNLRLRFEQIIRETKITRDRLAQQRDATWPELSRLRSQEEPSQEVEDRIAALAMGFGAAADQSKHDVDKNQNESRGVEGGFRDILEELENNRIQFHSSESLERIRNLIVQPLEEINDRRFLEVDRAIGILRLADDRGTDPLPGLNNSIDSLENLIQHMEKVLAEMQKLVEFHEAIQELTEIIAGGKDIEEKIREEQKRKLIEDFGLPEN